MADVVKKATRESYGEALAELSTEFEDFVVLDADLAAATKTGVFKKACPERFFDCGIAEANMMGVAAGIASTGRRVFASSFAMFAAGRAFEVVRNSIGYPHLNVNIGATHAGISVGEDGATHQCCEDIALMRTIPGMTIINPADHVEAKAAVRAALELDGPVYMRFGRLAVPIINDEKTYRFEVGKGVTLRDGKDITVIATGLMVNEAVNAAAVLAEEGIDVRVINIHTIKPLDRELVIKAARETGLIVTAEEHSVIGGLGSAVAEAVTEECPVPVIKIGVKDVFGQSGPAAELLKLYGLSAENIADTVRKALKKGK
ncbi:MAG: transketolase family protein [Ruminococcus sp.]|nr:transketolase family protein [Ruminococcus sp.]